MALTGHSLLRSNNAIFTGSQPMCLSGIHAEEKTSEKESGHTPPTGHKACQKMQRCSGSAVIPGYNLCRISGCTWK
jgi:hypothetical protein